MSLNVEQRKAYDKVTKKRRGVVLITGHAGCGKTHLAVEIVKDFLHRGKTVQVLCPTHQAKLQFSMRLPEKAKGLEIDTVAKYLGQFPMASQTGELVFQRGGIGLGAYAAGEDVIVIDETSMVSDYEISELKKAGRVCLVIFLGDFNQLLPVMKKSGHDSFGKTETFELIHQHRNAGPILKLAEKARHAVIYPTVSNENIKVHDRRSDQIATFIKQITAAKSPTDFVYCAYRNAQVNRVRQVVHHELYGLKPFYKGQYIRLDAPAHAGNNGDIVIIEKIKHYEHEIAGKVFDVYSLQLNNLNRGIVANDFCVAPQDQTTLVAMLDELYELSGKAFKRDKSAWEIYQRKIKDIRRITFYSSPFASTVHKCQGRSIPRVFVDTYDISTGSGKKRLLYVAYSRAMIRLHTVRIMV